MIADSPLIGKIILILVLIAIDAKKWLSSDYGFLA